MSCLLHINTALEKAYVCLSEDNAVLGYAESMNQKDHSAFLQPAIQDMLKAAGKTMQDLHAVSVINGPGSYTGLRVGLSAAKGLCFALRIPLITLSTLEWLARPYIGADAELIMPMIDARRMEVFTAAYSRELNIVLQPSAVILDDNSFSEQLTSGRIIFTGNGAAKLPTPIIRHPNCLVYSTVSGEREQVTMANLLYEKMVFADLAYTEPFYLKAFHTPSSR